MMELALVLRWAVVLGFLTALGAPIAALVFARFPRRGGAFSLPVTLVLFATAVFLVGQVTFGYHTLAVGLGVVGALSAGALWVGPGPDWRAVVTSYGIFLVGFLLFAVYASESAGITPPGGEQFLHYGLTNTLAHTDVLPPEDFWFAGEPLRYYYGTQLQVAILSMLTGTEVRYGYFLGLSTFYALLFVSAYGLVGAVVASRGRPYHLGGVLGALFVAVAGTSITFLRQVFGRLYGTSVPEYGEAVFRGLVRERGMSIEEAVASQGGGDGHWLWFYERYGLEGALNEFPLYAFVKSDLHGHTLSTGYIVLAAAIAFSYYLTPAEERYRRLGLLYGGLGLVAGVFGFMNTWALPTAVGLAWLALASAEAHPASLLPDPVGAVLTPKTNTEDGDSPLWAVLPAESWRIVLAAALAAPVGLVGVLVASPFLLTSVPTNEGIGLFPPRTPLDSFLVLYGGILALFAAYLVVSAGPLSDLPRGHAVAGGVLGLAVVGTLTSSFAVSGLLVGFLLVAWWLVRTDRAGFTAVLLVGGLGLLLSLEVVHAKVYPFDRVRWNTTLKVAIQGWTLSGLAAGGASAILLSRATERIQNTRRNLRFVDSEFTAGSAVATAGPALLAVILVLAVVATSLPFAGLVFYHDVGSDGLSPTSGTLDGLAIHDEFKGDEMEALSWLDDRGEPTIAESPGRFPYQWTSVASVFTDSSAVVGWNHQEGYRGEEAFDRRASDVEELYTGELENATATLQRYEVEYIYVGPSERETFDEINEFGRLDGVSVAFENEAVTIYSVDHSATLRPDSEE